MAEEIGVAIIDLDMPVMNGIEMIATLRLNPGSSHLPVIVLSAFATDMPQPVHEVRSSLAGHCLIGSLTNARRFEIVTRALALEGFHCSVLFCVSVSLFMRGAGVGQAQRAARLPQALPRQQDETGPLSRP